MTDTVGTNDLRAIDGAHPEDESIEYDLVYLGMVGIIDPPRTEVRDAIAEAAQARIRVIMITGDHPRTAARIAGDLGIVVVVVHKHVVVVVVRVRVAAVV